MDDSKVDNNSTTMCSNDSQEGSDKDEKKSNDANTDKQLSARQEANNDNASVATQSLEQPCQVSKVESTFSSNNNQQNTNNSGAKSNKSRVLDNVVALDFPKNRLVTALNLESNEPPTALSPTVASRNFQDRNVSNIHDINMPSHSSYIDTLSRDKHCSLDDSAAENTESPDNTTKTITSKEQQETSHMCDLAINNSRHESPIAKMNCSKNIPKSNAFAAGKNIVTPNALQKGSNENNFERTDKDLHNNNSAQVNITKKALPPPPNVSILGNLSIQTNRESTIQNTPLKLLTNLLATDNSHIEEDRESIGTNSRLGNDNGTHYTSCIDSEDYAEDGIRNNDDMSALGNEFKKSENIGGVLSQLSNTNNASSRGVSTLSDSRVPALRWTRHSVASHEKYREQDILLGIDGLSHEGTKEYHKQLWLLLDRLHNAEFSAIVLNKAKEIFIESRFYIRQGSNWAEASQKYIDTQIRNSYSSKRRRLLDGTVKNLPIAQKDKPTIMHPNTLSVSAENRLLISPTEKDFVFGVTGFRHRGTEHCKNMMRSYIKSHPKGNGNDFMDVVDTILKGRQCFVFNNGVYVTATEAEYDKKLRQMFADFRKTARNNAPDERRQESLVTDLNCTDSISTEQLELHCGLADERYQTVPAYDSDNSSSNAASSNGSHTSVPYTERDVLFGKYTTRHPGSKRLREVIQSIIHDRKFQFFKPDVVTRVRHIMDGVRYFHEESDEFVEASDRQVNLYISQYYGKARRYLSRKKDMEATLAIDSPSTRHTNHAKVHDVILSRKALGHPGTVECRKIIHNICRDTPNLSKSQFLAIVGRTFKHNRFLVEADGVRKQATAEQRDSKLWSIFLNCRRYYKLSQENDDAASDNSSVCSVSSSQILDVDDSRNSHTSTSSKANSSSAGKIGSVNTDENGSSSEGEVCLRESDILCGATGKGHKGTIAYRAVYSKWCNKETDMSIDELVQTIICNLQGRRFVKRMSNSLQILSVEERFNKIAKNCREYCTKNKLTRPKSASINGSVKPVDTDVILGKSSLNHPGTIVYRETVKQLSIDYPKMATGDFFRSLRSEMKNSRFLILDDGRYRVADQAECIAKASKLYLDCLRRNRTLKNQDVVNSDAESIIPATEEFNSDEESDTVSAMSDSGYNNVDSNGSVDANIIRDTDVLCTGGGVHHSGTKTYRNVYESLCKERSDLTIVQITKLVLYKVKACRFVKKRGKTLTILTPDERYHKVHRNCMDYCRKCNLQRNVGTGADTAADIADNESIHSTEGEDERMETQSVGRVSGNNSSESDSVNDDTPADSSIEDDVSDGSVNQQQHVAADTSGGANIHNKHYFTTSWQEFLRNAKTHCERIKTECMNARGYGMLPTYKLQDKLLDVIDHYERTFSDLDSWRNEDRECSDRFIKKMNESEQKLRNFIHSVVYYESDADA